MLYHNVRLMGSYLQFVDAVSLFASSTVLWRVGSHSLGATWPNGHSIPYFLLAFNLAAFLFVGGRLHAYHARRTEDLTLELVSLAEVTFYSTGLTCLASLLMPGVPSYSFWGAVLVFNTFALLFSRLLMRVVIRFLRSRGADYRVWLVVGENKRTRKLVHAVELNPHYGIRIAEVVDLPKKAPANLGSEWPVEALPTRQVQTVDEIRELVAHSVIDEVVVTLPVRSFYDEIQQIVDVCSEAGISVKLPPEAFARAGCRTELGGVGTLSMVTHFTGPSNHTQLLVKRIVDALGAAATLLASLPLMTVIAAAIKLTSRGSVFFVQTRIGLHGRQFQMIKFRSMVNDAPALRHELERFNERDAVAFKMRNDPRVTVVGKILRKYHLDELPQLWNVLVGDMSLVGPRPLPPGEASGNEWWQRRRLSMPPGMTCLWQIRCDPKMPFQDWMRLDLAYVDSWSVWLDLRLLALTFPAVLRGAGW